MLRENISYSSNEKQPSPNCVSQQNRYIWIERSSSFQFNLHTALTYRLLWRNLMEIQPHRQNDTFCIKNASPNVTIIALGDFVCLKIVSRKEEEVLHTATPLLA